jgi:hypothetical protein
MADHRVAQFYVGRRGDQDSTSAKLGADAGMHDTSSPGIARLVESADDVISVGVVRAYDQDVAPFADERTRLVPKLSPGRFVAVVPCALERYRPILP